MKKSQTPAASSGAAPQEREYDRLSDRLEAAGLPALECAEGQSCGSLDAVRALLSRLAPAAPQDEDEIQRLRAKLAAAQHQAKVYRNALEDILTADETSTLEGALAIARAAVQRGYQDAKQPPVESGPRPEEEASPMDIGAARLLASTMHECIDWNRRDFDFNKAERRILQAFEAARIEEPRRRKPFVRYSMNQISERDGTKPRRYRIYGYTEEGQRVVVDTLYLREIDVERDEVKRLKERERTLREALKSAYGHVQDKAVRLQILNAVCPVSQITEADVQWARKELVTLSLVSPTQEEETP